MILDQKRYAIQELKQKLKLIDKNYILPINSTSNKLFIINFDNLDIDIKGGYPKYYYNQSGIYAIQLRPITEHEKTLLIGCGNNPTSVYYHYPNCFKSDNLIKQNKYNCICGNNHLHKGCITIDPNISMNPTIVTMFGKSKLTFLEDSSFHKILTEGLNISNFKYFKKEKKRLLIKH
jgi:hypothetical protein